MTIFATPIHLRGRVAGLVLIGALSAGGAGLDAQVEERFPGVSLGLQYETRPLPALAIQPFTAPAGAEPLASQVENIVARDLRYSDRFNVMANLPTVLAREGVDYEFWDQIGAVWLVAGRIEGSGNSTVLLLELHDVTYRQVRQRGRIPIRALDSPDFRMSVHVASDAVVQWAFGEPGIAATRIAFSRRMDDGTQDLWIIDSDGENLRRLTRHQVMGFGQPISLGPAWSPDGTRLAYQSFKDVGMPRIYQLNLVTGQETAIPTPRDGDYITPSYHPDGERIFFAVNGSGRNGLYSYNIARGCCFTPIFEGRSNDLSPTFSADGTRMAFNSLRLGDGAPQIYVMPADGSGRPELVSPYVYDRPGFYTSPDWCRTGGMMLFHGRVFERGAHQILVADMTRRAPLVQLTFEGVNEDPSCAPDGRHLVYSATRSSGHSLRIVDMVTGNERTLVSGIEPILPAWSPQLPLR
ncbi:MAG: hypothetical protein WEG36_13805 [Gemmatimonadota bacterium]